MASSNYNYYLLINKFKSHFVEIACVDIIKNIYYYYNAKVDISSLKLKIIVIIMWKITLYMIVGLVSAEQATFDNYKVFKIATITQTQVELLNQLAEIPDGVSKFLIKTSKRKLIYFMQKFLS